MKSDQARIHELQGEVARDPGSDAFVLLADLYRAQGRLDVAARGCRRGLARHPDHVEGHYVLGRIRRDAGDAVGAYDEWDIALALDPAHGPSRRAAAFLCLERGDTREAEKHLRRALEIDPDDPRIRRGLDFLEGRLPVTGVGSEYWDAAAPLIQREVDEFARETRVRLVLVIDASGRVLAQVGFSRGVELSSFASLTAGIHAASAEMARMLGQNAFSQLYQGAGENQIFVGRMQTPPGELLLVAVFGADSTIGLVRLLFRSVQSRLAAAKWPPLASPMEREQLDAALFARLRRVLDGTSVSPASRR